MQENVITINEFFPTAKVTVSGNSAKFGMHELNSVDLMKVAEIAKLSKSVNVKRSGTGLTVIFKF